MLQATPRSSQLVQSAASSAARSVKEIGIALALFQVPMLLILLFPALQPTEVSGHCGEERCMKDRSSLRGVCLSSKHVHFESL